MSWYNLFRRMLCFLSVFFFSLILPMCSHSYCSRMFKATVLFPSPKIKLAVFLLDSSWFSRQENSVKQELNWAFLLSFFFLSNGRLAFLGGEVESHFHCKLVCILMPLSSLFWLSCWCCTCDLCHPFLGFGVKSRALPFSPVYHSRPLKYLQS